jgi:hypothetical protein
MAWNLITSPDTTPEPIYKRSALCITVTNLALVMEEHRAAHRVAGLALVQPGMAPIGSPAELLRARGEHRVRQANGRHRPFTWAGRLGSRSEATDRWPLAFDRCTSLRRARHFDAADRKAAQLQFAGRNVAGDPMHLSPQFEASVLRADPPRGGRRLPRRRYRGEDGPLGHRRKP